MTDHAGLGGGRGRPLRPAARARPPARHLDARVRRGDDAARSRGRGRAGARLAQLAIDGAAPAGYEHAHHRGGGADAAGAVPRRAGCCSRASNRWPASRSCPARCCCRWPRSRCRRRARASFALAAAAAAVAFSVVVWLVATVGRDRIWAGAESMGAVTRLDGEDRALARWLRAHRRAHEPVMIEPLAFAEIGVAHAAGVPWTESVTLIVTREPRATVAESMAATGARFVVGYDRAGGWPRRLPDWPLIRRENRSMANNVPLNQRGRCGQCGRCRLRGAPGRS